MPRYLCLLFSILLLTGCENADRSRQPGDQALALNIYTEPPTLDPGEAVDVPSLSVLQMLFEGLLRAGPGEHPEPGVAERIDISDDGYIYTFHLRESVWSDGTPVTSYDFAYAWRRVLTPEFPMGHAQLHYVIKNAEAAKKGEVPVSDVGIATPDSRTLVVELERPTPHFLEMLVSWSYLPVPKHIVEANEHWAREAGPSYVSNGPFNLHSWKHHNEIKLKKNPSYWDADAVHLDSITMTMIEDVTTELSLFEDGDIDWTGKPLSIGLPTDALKMLKDNDRISTAPLAATYLYVLNTTKYPVSNNKLRQALAYAIDRRSIVDSIAQGDEEPASGIVPPSMSQRSYAYFKDHDVAKAQQLFAEALEELSITIDEFPPLTLIYNTSESHHKIAQAVQQEWNEILGIKVQLQNMEWKAYVDRLMRKDYDIARISNAALYNAPMAFLETYKSADIPSNITGWESNAFAELLNEAMDSTEPQDRLAHLREAEELLIRGMPFIPMFHMTSPHIRNPKLNGIYISPGGYVDFKRAYFED